MKSLLWVIAFLFASLSHHATGTQLLTSKAANKISTSTIVNEEQLARAVRESIREHELKQRRHRNSRKKRAVKSVCYKDLGCFEDSGPFAYLEMLPSPPEEINTKFYFYSTKHRSDRPLMELPFLNMTAAFARYKNPNPLTADVTTEGLAAPITTTGPTAIKTTSNLNKNKSFKKAPITIDELEGFDELSVRVIVHGFGSACPHVWIYEMKTALMAVEDCIVICVDWENGATFPNYVRAAANTRLVGKQLALLLQNLREHKGLNLTRTHLIGFSLGAHASGFAGAETEGLSRITGLDPAGPLFEAQHPKVRLDSSDAEFVDVIHSNGENLILGGLGSWQPMGHVDFYPNGGRVQNGCSNLFVGAVTDFIWSAQTADEEEGRSLCNHRRAYKFFIDSVAPRCMFPAYPCANYDDFLKGKCFPCANEDGLSDDAPRCGNMGYYADRSTGRGQLYLATREEEPFCAHQFQLQIFNAFNDLPLRTIGRLEAILEGDGGLNETFKISEKDDSEFFAGDIISKIIVPHPALGFPTTLSLHYKSYSGWLSKGLPHWDIDKVVLMDSFGRSHSICKISTKLTSGSPVRLKLQPGNCKLDNQEDYGVHILPQISPSTEGPGGIFVYSETDHVDNINKRKDILNLGSKFNLNKNDTLALDENQNLPWHPILEGNSLDRETQSESSRGFSEQPQEIFEPVLTDRRMSLNHGRNFDDETAHTGEIVEPILRATTPKMKKAKEISFNTDLIASTTMTTTKTNSTINFIKIKSVTSSATEQPKPEAQMGSTSETPITVQILPFRLGELLQRAERYARETLLPLISVQAPRFFGFNVEETKTTDVARKPRYIPRYDEGNVASRLRRNRTRVKNTTAKQHDLFDLLRQEKVTNLEIQQPQRKQQEQQKERSMKDIFYYTNIQAADSHSLRPESPEYQPVFISLPTYKPSAEKSP